MADFSTPEGLAEFKAAKGEQLAWALACGLPGLQSVTTGRTFGLTMSTDEFYETVYIGQVPREEFSRERTKGKDGKPVYEIRLIPENKRKRGNRPIDLTDEQVTAILDRWAKGETALALPFVLSVWGRDGQERANG